jgi:protein-tyrosine-phosphatase
MRGGSGIRQTPQTAQPGSGKKRVLFVCIGNSCRSQMAEAFARSYSRGAIEIASAGIAPAVNVAPLTRETLAKWNLRIDDHFPKPIENFAGQHFDVVVNISGHPLPFHGARMVEWNVVDPIGQSPEVYRTVAAQIEALVMRLLLDLRS